MSNFLLDLLKFFYTRLLKPFAQSAKDVEYTDCTPVEG